MIRISPAVSEGSFNFSIIVANVAAGFWPQPDLYQLLFVLCSVHYPRSLTGGRCCNW